MRKSARTYTKSEHERITFPDDLRYYVTWCPLPGGGRLSVSGYKIKAPADILPAAVKYADDFLSGKAIAEAAVPTKKT